MVNTLPANEECNCFAVRAAARHVSQSYDQFLAPTGLRTTQLSILTKLKREGPLTINTLAEGMVMDRTTLGRNILPLERDRLIRIERVASDRNPSAVGTHHRRSEAASHCSRKPKAGRSSREPLLRKE